MKRVKLSQVEQFSVVRTKGDMAVITILDNVTEIPGATEDDAVSYDADMYQLMLPWRTGIDDAANYELFLARAKELEDPQTVADERIARDIVL